MKNYILLLLLIFTVSCSVDKEHLSGTLEGEIQEKEFKLESVIACAASSNEENTTSIFFYPTVNATNFQYYETESTDVAKDDFTKYNKIALLPENVFNGHLMKFNSTVAEGNWVIIAFDVNGITQISDPIKIKKTSKPTEYLPDNVTVVSPENEPTFSWKDGQYDDTVIYFQVVSKESGDLLSGTYTTEKTFTYYKTDNVVLNVTRNTPPELELDTPYNFTLMAVSEDNWVNLISDKTFTLGVE